MRREIKSYKCLKAVHRQWNVRNKYATAICGTVAMGDRSKETAVLHAFGASPTVSSLHSDCE